MARKLKDPLDFLRQPAATVAPQLLGCLLEYTYGNQKALVRIVETEAYDQTDVASHSYNGETPRTKVMFGPAGYLYVYFTYGMHYCCNIVVGVPGHGAAVLIRAVEPVYEQSRQLLQVHRDKGGVELCNGPAKLCQALGITKSLNGHDLRTPPLRLVTQPTLPNKQITMSTRIGISRGKDVPWRFYITSNPFVSRPWH